MMLRWPFSALLVWTFGWLCYGLLLLGDIPALAAILWSALIGMLASAVARLRGYSTMRVAVFALGFPVSALLSGVVALPPWMWLLPLAVALLFYPLHTLRDAPVFPTPLHALRELYGQAALPPQALILDAGCGAGDGLRALRLAYPQARLVGIELSRPLCWMAKLRCPWASVLHGDIWHEDWGKYEMVYLFQRPESMPRAVAKARSEMRPGTWLVSLEFPALDLLPAAVLSAGEERSLWLYRLPFIDATHLDATH